MYLLNISIPFLPELHYRQAIRLLFGHFIFHGMGTEYGFDKRCKFRARADNKVELLLSNKYSTVEFDGRKEMKTVGRFLYPSWTNGGGEEGEE